MIDHDKFLKEHQEEIQNITSSAIAVGCSTYAASYMV